MLPRSIFGVGLAPGQFGWRQLHCELFVIWGCQRQVRSGGHFHLLRLVNCAFNDPSIRCRPAVIYDARDRANPFARPAATAPSAPWSTLCQSGSLPYAAPGEHSGNASSPAACGLTEAASRKPLSPTDRRQGVASGGLEGISDRAGNVSVPGI